MKHASLMKTTPIWNLAELLVADIQDLYITNVVNLFFIKLRNLLFNRGSQNGNQNGHQNDAKKLLLKKRARSAEKDKAAEKVDRFTEHKNKISIWETRQLFASRKSISIPFIKLVQQCKLFFIHIERLS